MDRLANNYSTPKKVTEFERKVGESVCRAAELAMCDLEFNADQPKYRLVSAPTGGSKTSSSIALLAMLANEDPEFSGAYICRTIEECEAQSMNLKTLVDPSILAVLTSLHMFNPKPNLVAEKKEINVVASEHYWPESIKKKQLVITTHSRWENEIKSSKDLGVRKYRDRRRNLIIVDEEPELCSIHPCLPHYVSELADVVSSYSDSIKNNSDNFSIIYEANELTKILRRIYTKMADLTDTSIDKATYIAADLIEDVEDLAIGFCKPHRSPEFGVKNVIRSWWSQIPNAISPWSIFTSGGLIDEERAEKWCKDIYGSRDKYLDYC